MPTSTIKSFISALPKAELHLHIEGTFEPELMFELARRNSIPLKYKTVEELKAAYQFNNLQEFLDMYHAGASVLLHEQDFYDLTYAYLKKVHSQNVLHVEVFFDHQTHLQRGISFATVITGIRRAMEDGKRDFGISYELIMCFLRNLSEEAAFQTLETARPYKDWIVGIGLASSELGHPPSKFERVFEQARKEGYLLVAHAGEEGPAEYVWEAINLLKVNRIDHGNHCMDDESLVQELARRQTPLTLCPLSNLELKVVKDLKDYPLKEMMRKGLMLTINSDDPAYFGGYINENYEALVDAIGLSKEELAQLAKNSFQASFLNEADKEKMISIVEAYNQANKG